MTPSPCPACDGKGHVWVLGYKGETIGTRACEPCRGTGQTWGPDVPLVPAPEATKA